MVEPWRIELQTFALRRRIYERFYWVFKRFSKLLYSYQQYKTLMNWDKCGTRYAVSANGGGHFREAQELK
jgi:hypothetical protein